jgi:transposase InsO family protein
LIFVFLIFFIIFLQINLGENSPIVIDNGSGYVKAGFSCTDRPVAVIPTMVGRPHDRIKEEEEEKGRKKQDKAEKEYFIGDEAKLKRGALAISFISYFKYNMTLFLLNFIFYTIIPPRYFLEVSD